MRECVVLAETDQLDDVTSSMMVYVSDIVRELFYESMYRCSEEIKTRCSVVPLCITLLGRYLIKNWKNT
jgi:hypothetical protein